MKQNRFFETGEGLKFAKTKPKITDEDRLLVAASIEAQKQGVPVSKVLQQMKK
jgi:hypothetical protein